jgi:flavin-dependent dehydrogenase
MNREAPLPPATQSSAAVTHDVAIIGGGLAGLTLALQLRQRMPQRSIVVLERNSHPVREAAHKVGESTVEIGAHYFANVIGLKEHLQTSQLRKFGLRFFFDATRADDLASASEVGATGYFTVPSYQLDRGILENHLGSRIRTEGIDFRDGCVVRDLDMGKDGEEHRLHYVRGSTPGSVRTRWLVDASSRASPLKRKLGLARPNAHHVNAAWFRLAVKIDVDDWSQDAHWRTRCQPPHRWLSTNHLMGPGYWVWVIPLASGSTSVGIVADPDLHPLETYNDFDKALDWLRREQPMCAAVVEENRHLLQDFRFLRHFSHDCAHVYSADRWALTGEAGVFLDPFYSPGSDFIGISNGYVTDLIARDFAGERIAARASVYEQLYFSFYRSTLALYEGQYPLFGNLPVMSVKIIWDYAYYWGVLAPLFIAGRLTDLSFITRLRAELQGAQQLNLRMQKFFRDWHDQAADSAAGNVDQSKVRWLAQLNQELTLEDTAEDLHQRLNANIRELRRLAAEVTGEVRLRHPQIDTTDLPTEEGGGHLLELFGRLLPRGGLRRQAIAPFTPMICPET